MSRDVTAPAPNKLPERGIVLGRTPDSGGAIDLTGDFGIVVNIATPHYIYDGRGVLQRVAWECGMSREAIRGVKRLCLSQLGRMDDAFVYRVEGGQKVRFCYTNLQRVAAFPTRGIVGYAGVPQEWILKDVHFMALLLVQE